MVPKHILVPDGAHGFIVNVQPNFPTIVISILMKHVDRIVPAACGLSVVI
jgi:hypothetical protein